MTQENQQNVTIRMPVALIHKLDEKARSEVSTRSQVMRTILARALGFVVQEDADGPTAHA